jgi:hypothetical protein
MATYDISNAGTVNANYFIGDGSGLTNLPGGGGGGGMSIVPPILSTILLSTGLLTASSISTNTISTNYGYFSTISAGSIYGQFIGDGSLLSNLPTAGITTLPSNISTNLLSTTSLTAENASISSMSAGQAYISSLRVDSLQIGLSSGYISLGDIVTTSISSLVTNTDLLAVNYGYFSTISAGSIYGKFIGDGSLLSNLPTGGITTLPSNISTSLLSTTSLTAESASISSISAGQAYISSLRVDSLQIGLSSGYISLGDIVTTSISSLVTNTDLLAANYGYFSTISANKVYGQFYGDGSQLTGISASLPVPDYLSANTLSTNLLTACNVSTETLSTNSGYANTFNISNLLAQYATVTFISANQGYISSLRIDELLIGNDIGFTNMGDIIATSLSTILINTQNINAIDISSYTLSANYGFFSTLSSGSIYSKFIGDGSQLTNVSYSVPANLSTTLLSTGLLTACNISTFSISTNYGFFSTLSSGSIYAKFIGDGSLLTNVSYSVPANLSTITLSTGLLTACNISTDSISTNSAFFSTISANKVYGQFIGDGSMLTNLPTSSLSLSSGNISVSTITLIDTANNSTGTIYERSSLLYFNTFVVAGAYVWTSQLIVGN